MCTGGKTMEPNWAIRLRL